MDPFEQLEIVWESLESWFDLLQVELDKVVKSESSNQASESSAEISSESVELGAEATSIEDAANLSPDNKGSSGSSGYNGQQAKLSPVSLTSSNSVLAAAIVNSAPSHRRAAFLLTTNGSVDHAPSSISGNN